MTLRTLELIPLLHQSCSTCEFWDRENIKEVFPSGRKCAPCDAPRAFWIDPYLDNQETWEDVGQDCPVYQERKDAK